MYETIYKILTNLMKVERSDVSRCRRFGSEYFVYELKELNADYVRLFTGFLSKTRTLWKTNKYDMKYQ
jgi:hypothetical protein